MVKYNYFENLERLSILAERAVQLACGTARQGARPLSQEQEKQELPSLRRACDRLVCELEDALFSDFLPPLERESIAACAHCLSRVIDQASELWGYAALTATGGRGNEEGQICIRLAEQIKRATSMLRTIRKPDEMPDVQGFRALLAEGRAAHNTMLTKLHTGVFPRSSAQLIILSGRLRCELSRTFDELVEIMLNNI